MLKSPPASIKHQIERQISANDPTKLSILNKKLLCGLVMVGKLHRIREALKRPKPPPLVIPQSVEKEDMEVDNNRMSQAKK